MYLHYFENEKHNEYGNISKQRSGCRVNRTDMKRSHYLHIVKIAYSKQWLQDCFLIALVSNGRLEVLRFYKTGFVCNHLSMYISVECKINTQYKSKKKPSHMYTTVYFIRTGNPNCDV